MRTTILLLGLMAAAGGLAAEPDRVPSPAEPELRTAAEYVQRARTRIVRRDFEGALADADAALRLTPNFGPALLTRGTIKNRLRHPQDALRDLQAAADAGERSAELAGERGQAFLYLRLYEKALEATDQALAMDPAYERAYFVRAQVKEQTRDIDGALAEYGRGLKLNPSSAMLLSNRAELCRNERRFQEAIQDLTAIIRLRPSQVAVAHLQRGNCEMQLGQPAEALADFDTALRLDPNLTDGWRLRATLKAEQRDFAGALADAGQAIALEPRTPAVYLDRAHILCVHGRFAEALPDFDKCLQLKPDHVPALIRRGSARHFCTQYSAALADLNRALEIEPRDADALRERARVFLKMDDRTRARADYDLLLQVRPHPEVWAERGHLRARGNDFPGAIADYTAALRLKADCTQALVGRGLVKQALGELDGAVEDFQAAIPCPAEFFEGNIPSAAVAHAQLGYINRDRGNRQATREHFERALQLCPQAAAALSYRADLKHELQDLQGAIADCTLAIEAAPDQVWAYIKRGNFRLEAKDYSGAIADLTAALKLNPASRMLLLQRGKAKAARRDYAGALADYDLALRQAVDYRRGHSDRGVSWTGPQTSGHGPGPEDLVAADLNNPFDYLVRAQPGESSVGVSNSQAEDAIIYCLRGETRFQMGDFQQAGSELDAAIEANPRSADAYSKRAGVRAYRHDAAGAISDYTRAIDLDPRDLSHLTSRGVVRALQGDFAAALQDLNGAVQPGPAQAVARFQRGRLLCELREWDLAISDLHAAQQLRSPRGGDRASLGLWVARSGQGRQAEADRELAEYARTRTQGSPPPWFSRLAAFLLGQLDEDALLQEAQARDVPPHPKLQCQAYHAAGMKRWLSGDRAGALERFRKCVATGLVLEDAYLSAAFYVDIAAQKIPSPFQPENSAWRSRLPAPPLPSQQEQKSPSED